MKRIAIGLPSRSEMQDFETTATIMRMQRPIHVHKAVCGLVGLSNNLVWTEFLNKQLTDEAVDYFVMVHDDVVPLTVGWIDVLVAEIDRLDADVVSAIIPYKDNTGRTSTGLADAVDPFISTRRLTLKECFNLPETFGQEIAPAGKIIQINTGLMILNARADWVNKVWFENYDRIMFHEGKYYPVSVSEDENFSRMVQNEGGRVYATRKIAVEHRGVGRYRNTEPWGRETDEDYARVFGEGTFEYEAGNGNSSL